MSCCGKTNFDLVVEVEACVYLSHGCVVDVADLPTCCLGYLCAAQV